MNKSKKRRGSLIRALEGIWTPNLLIRSQMLYPLSYERMFHCRSYCKEDIVLTLWITKSKFLLPRRRRDLNPRGGFIPLPLSRRVPWTGLGDASQIQLQKFMQLIQHYLSVLFPTTLERRAWDLNPRGARTPSGFQDRCHRPLGEPSTLNLSIAFIIKYRRDIFC